MGRRMRWRSRLNHQAVIPDRALHQAAPSLELPPCTVPSRSACMHSSSFSKLPLRRRKCSARLGSRPAVTSQQTIYSLRFYCGLLKYAMPFSLQEYTCVRPLKVHISVVPIAVRASAGQVHPPSGTRRNTKIQKNEIRKSR